MHYVYVLRSKKDGELYTGCTNNIEPRLKMHNKGQIESTKLRRPFALVYYECFLDKSDAFERERWLKTGWGRSRLKKILKNYLKNLGG